MAASDDFEIAGPVGNRIRTQWKRPSAELTEQFRGFPTGFIGDAMSRLGVMSGHIRPLWSGAAVHGTVLPILVRSGDNLKIHQAMQIALPGDVLVVNGQGSMSHGLFGELMATAAIAQGITGLVVDGAVRDIAQLESLNFPVFGRGICPAGPSKEGSGEVGYPVACGGLVCSAGDLIIGDDDGIVVIPREDLLLVLEATRTVALWEEKVRADLAEGRPILITKSGSAL
jgi:4-hydroxy-4-methyl-2-oxoglutarate aldolase